VVHGIVTGCTRLLLAPVLEEFFLIFLLLSSSFFLNIRFNGHCVLLDCRDKSLPIQRFGGVIVAACVETFLAILGHGVCGQCDYWARVVFLSQLRVAS